MMKVKLDRLKRRLRQMPLQTMPWQSWRLPRQRQMLWQPQRSIPQRALSR